MGLCNGEPGRNRTCDPRIKSALLYQLSYGPHALNLTQENRGPELPHASIYGSQNLFAGTMQLSSRCC